jgi:hypothetical protein
LYGWVEKVVGDLTCGMQTHNVKAGMGELPDTRVKKKMADYLSKF